MFQVRPSAAVSENTAMRSLTRKRGQGNCDWLAKALTAPSPVGSILLVGGASPMSFRLRAAQAVIRRDLLPSFWSHVALVTGQNEGHWTLAEISLDPAQGFGDVPAVNAVQNGSAAAYDDPELYPNIAVISMTVDAGRLPEGDTSFEACLERNVRILSLRRTALNFASGLVDWLGYSWGAAGATNPLARGVGIPSAVFVENAFAGAGVELTPGLASDASCPEAIWQSAKWWHDFYESPATPTGGALTGRYSIGQPAAAAIDGRRRK